jgi:hypothetical protein
MVVALCVGCLYGVGPTMPPLGMANGDKPFRTWQG